MKIRVAQTSDAPSIGAVQVRAWQVGYRGEFPDSFLDTLDPHERAEEWRPFIDREQVIVAEIDHVVVGFAAFGASPDPVGSGEVFALNVHPDQWSRGCGSGLLATAVTALETVGYRDAVLWTGVGNHRSRVLYARHGWNPDLGSTRDADVMGSSVPEIRYRRSLGGSAQS